MALVTSTPKEIGSGSYMILGLLVGDRGSLQEGKQTSY